MTIRTYDYKGYSIYGAGDMWILDNYVDYDFTGNVTEQLISEGAEFIETGKDIYGREEAVLKFKHIEASFIRG